MLTRSNPDAEFAIRFLRLILPEEGDGYYIAAIRRTRGGLKHQFAATVEELWSAIESADRGGFDTFHACASFKEPFSDPQGIPAGERRFGRTKHNVRGLKSFFLDIDAGPEKSYTDQHAARIALANFCRTLKLPTPILVDSGLGLHVYWPLQRTLDPDIWQRYASGLKNLCQQYGLEADPTRTADISSVLRTPGTINRKRKKAVEFDPEYLEKIHPYAIEQFEIFAASADMPRSSKHATVALAQPDKIPEYLLRDKPAHIAKAMHQVSTHVPVSGLQVAERCGQVRALRETKGNLPEPLWYAALGVLAFCEDGEQLAHEWSNGYPGYTARETQERLERWHTLSGATTCKHFHSRNPAICDQCSLWGKIKSPITAGSYDLESPPRTNKKTGDARASGPAPLLAWEYTQGGALKPKSYANTHNAIVELRIHCRHDLFHDRKIVEGDVIENLGPELSDAICRAVRELIIRQYGVDPGLENTQQVLERACEQWRFDPIVNYLDALHWDQQPRIDRWLITYMGAEDTEFNRTVGRLALTAAVCRARSPGCKFDQIIVLEGVEGTNKSTAIELLAGKDNFSDQTILGLDDRTQMERLKGKWLYEIADLIGMSKSDVDAIKAFASRTVDRARAAWGRYVTERARRCIFFATTNDETYLKSRTGNRRFWPVRTGRIDIEALRRDRDQLWAEAAQVEASCASLALPEHLWSVARAEQDKRQEHDPWDDILADVKCEEVCAASDGEGEEERIASDTLLRAKLSLDASRIRDWEAKRLSHCMRRLGWEGPTRMRIKGKVTRGYRRKPIVKPIL